MKKIVMPYLCLLYEYYSQGSQKRMAYESSLFALLTISFINFYTVVVLCDLNRFIPINANDPRWWAYVVFLVGFGIPGLTLLRSLFKKEEIEKCAVNIKGKKWKNRIIILYIIISVIAFFEVVSVK
jgi:hypothetical protein